MGVQSQIDRIITAVGNAYRKVSERGGTVPASQTVANLAMAIDSIPAGGATKPYIEEIYDSDGNLIDVKLYGYTKIRDSAFYNCTNLALTSLPEGGYDYWEGCVPRLRKFSPDKSPGRDYEYWILCIFSLYRTNFFNIPWHTNKYCIERFPELHKPDHHKCSLGRGSSRQCTVGRSECHNQLQLHGRLICRRCISLWDTTSQK